MKLKQMFRTVIFFIYMKIRATNGRTMDELHEGQCGDCVFPFIYKGRYHDTCTTFDDAEPWCSTSKDLNSGGKWIYCEEKTCPGTSLETTPQISVNPKNAVGNCYCGVPNYRKSKIVGGDPLPVGLYPWQVAILYSEKLLQNQQCGGTLVGNRHVITAAHCTIDLDESELFVRIGDTSFDTKHEVSNARTLNVKKIINHPKYVRATNQHDISILVLKSKVSLRKFPNIKPVCLPIRGAKFSGTGFVSGWGTEKSGGPANSWLHGAKVHIFKGKANCENVKSMMTNDMICAGYKDGGIDTCQGDSGGPLIARDHENNNGWMTLVGVTSWGLGCADPGYIGVYSEVAHHMRWLKENMEDLETCPAFHHELNQDSNLTFLHKNS